MGAVHGRRLAGFRTFNGTQRKPPQSKRASNAIENTTVKPQHEGEKQSRVAESSINR
jgi:hypothetical protein